MIQPFQDQVVLVTGGTRGIGLATALAFAGRGARCVLTYRWGSDDADALRQRFCAQGAPEPLLIQADVSQQEDTEALFNDLKNRFPRIDVFISNATGAVVVRSLEDLTERALLQSIRYAVWPTADYLFRIRKTFGSYPRYLVAMSSNGPDNYSKDYDLVATSKAALEALCRYLTYRLRQEDICINVLRTRGVRTDAYTSTFGELAHRFAEKLDLEKLFLTEEAVADAALALCSGLLDGMRGQVLTVDRGTIFFDNIAWLYENRDRLPQA